jgi:hypothetical protein
MTTSERDAIGVEIRCQPLCAEAQNDKTAEAA